MVDAGAGFGELADKLRREGAGEDGVARHAVGLRHGCHVFGVASAPLDLEGGDAGRDEPVEEGEREKVARREDCVARDVKRRGGVRVLADLLDAVEAAAGLAALAAVGRKTVGFVREEAAPRFGDADRAVDEGLDLDAALARDFGNFIERAFAGEDDALRAHFLQEARSGAV